jgi:hypothetical protein
VSRLILHINRTKAWEAQVRCIYIFRLHNDWVAEEMGIAKRRELSRLVKRGGFPETE